MQRRTKAPPAKTEPSMSGTENIDNHQFKRTKIENSKGAELVPQKVHSPFLKEESQQAASPSETGIGPPRPLQVTKSSHDTGHSNLKATENQPDSSHDWSSEQHDSSGNMVGMNGKAIDSVDSPKINFRRASNDKVKPMSCCQREHDVFEGSDAWIFPYEPRNLCITTGGKLAMHLMGCCSIETSRWRGKSRISIPKNAGEVYLRLLASSLLVHKLAVIIYTPRFKPVRAGQYCDELKEQNLIVGVCVRGCIS